MKLGENLSQNLVLKIWLKFGQNLINIDWILVKILSKFLLDLEFSRLEISTFQSVQNSVEFN